MKTLKIINTTSVDCEVDGKRIKGRMVGMTKLPKKKKGTVFIVDPWVYEIAQKANRHDCRCLATGNYWDSSKYRAVPISIEELNKLFNGKSHIVAEPIKFGSDYDFWLSFTGDESVKEGKKQFRWSCCYDGSFDLPEGITEAYKASVKEGLEKIAKEIVEGGIFYDESEIFASPLTVA